jgi:hypothetical protein
MKPRVCVCCGEPISDKGNALSRNPSLCASCSSLADGMGEADTPQSPCPEAEQPPACENPAEVGKAA